MPKVTVLCITYNHEKFIRQTLDSFIMQKTNFPFEVIIGDDGSTDKTQEIIKEYANKYPDIIKPVLRKKNIGTEANSLDISTMVKSEYVASCEGDDYFTDPLKLQKQADFLDANPDFSVCFHPVLVTYEDGSKPDSIFPCEEMRFNQTVLQLEHLIVHNFIQTNSVMYRWIFSEQYSIKDVFPKDILPGDYFLHMLHAQKGKIGFINDVMASYRRHPESLWWDTSENLESLHLRHGIQELKFFLELEKWFPQYHQIKGHEFTRRLAMLVLSIYLKHKRFKEMQEILKLCPDVINKAQQPQ